jgi:hypothetical protein
MSKYYLGDGPSGAVFSANERYRFSLWRRWKEDVDRREMVAFIGLNPSTADETKDDPTIRRCRGFAKDWGYGGMMMLNIFAFRATDPEEMKAAFDPVGVGNDDALLDSSSKWGKIICCWGAHGGHLGRSERVQRRLVKYQIEAYHLGLTQKGEPRHPLYLRADTKPVLWF